jgi:hypothetical protein
MPSGPMPPRPASDYHRVPSIQSSSIFRLSPNQPGVVDTQVAGALIRAAQAVELLGARVVLTGIRPEVAQTLVGIGVNLGNIVTRGTLRDGISYALARR